MAEKRIIEQTSSTEIYSGDWFVKDSAADGTTKIQPSKVKEYMNAGTATSDALADEYDSTHSYSEGDVCTYEDVLYKANASTTGTWDITKWDAVTVADLIEEGGKVKDVKVNGTSVVDEDKTANVSVPVLDVTVNGGSVVNNSKVAVLDALATYGEASGTIATFNDGSDLPVKELKVTIEPVQSGSGEPSPSNVRPISGWTGANIVVDGFNHWDEEIENGFINTSTGENTSDASGGKQWRCKNFIKVVPDASYYLKLADGYTTSNSNITAYYYDINKDFISSIGNIGNRTIQIPTNAYYLRFCNYFSVARQEAPTKNCVNISGDRNGQYEPYNGNLYTITWTEAGTVYGCTLNVTTGLLVVKNIYKNLGDFSWTYDTTTYAFPYYYTTNSVDDCANNNLICSIFKTAETSDEFAQNDYRIRFVTNGNKIRVRDSDYTSTSDFKTAMNGVQLVYELATPQTYQLTPTQVNTLLGENNIFADSGDINKVVYVRDNSLIIDNILSRLEALEG